MPCKPFSITLAVLAPDNKRQVSLGVTRGCINDDEPFYVIDFVLRDKIQGDFQDRVKLHVTIGDTDSEKAQRLIENGLTLTQIQFLQGPLTSKAKTLPSGTSTHPATEKAVATILNK